MCGIHGILSLRGGATPDPALLAAMGDVTVHRGPDDEGAYCDERIALGMRRLSIIDVGGGHQPIANEDETLWVICNGEIYNFRALRQELERGGHRFRTDSDSEVIVHLYEEHGSDLVSRLEGMFGFALWDSRRKRLMIGRDRLGIKPVYFMRDGERLVFASEAKAILALPGVSARVDEAALAEYLTLGYTPSWQSLFRGIEKLPPGSILLCEGGEITIAEYWRPPEGVAADYNEDRLVEEARALIESSVVSEMVSDVPLGAFLSGGIDSSAIVAMMARNSAEPIKTYSIGFDTGAAGAFYNELPFARRVAEQFGTEHKEILVRPQVSQLLPRLMWHLDEPVADSAFITTYLVAEFARRDVTVILSGVGGDELFGGYRRYLGEHYVSRYNHLPAWLRRNVIAPAVRLLPSDRHSALLNLSRYARAIVESSEQSFEERYRSYVEVFGRGELGRLLRSAPPGAADSLDRAFAASGAGDGLQQLMRVDLLTQMPNDLLMLTDKMTMAASIECRVPLLNHRLVELGARIPAETRIRGRDLKHVLKRALADVLPRDILYRSKRGFGAPMGAWLTGELRPLMMHLLSRESIERRGLLHWPVVEETIALHEARREDHTDHLLSLMNLELWARLYLDRRTPQDLTDELETVVPSTAEAA
jgi:asparagine synthase (glutamine-hydrolysing)